MYLYVGSVLRIWDFVWNWSNCMLRWGWVFLERMWIPSGIQFATHWHFIDFFVVKTKRFVGSFVNVILTPQICGQRSSRAAESQRRALENCFSERSCYMLQLSKFRVDRDLGLCTTSVLAFGEPQRSCDFQENNVFWRRKNRILPLRCGSPRVDLNHRFWMICASVM